MANMKKATISAKKVLVTSFLVDLLDIAMNLAVAIITGSVVMLAELLQGIADLTAAGFLLIGLKRSEIPADKTYPFGHGREMYFWTLLSSVVMLAVTAGLSFYFGFKRFLSPKFIDNLFLAYMALTIAIASNGYSLSLGIRRLLNGEKLTKIFHRFAHSSKVETKATFILDLIGTTSAILGLFALTLFGVTGNLRYDGLGAMIIGIALGVLSLLLLFSVRSFLIGKSAPFQTQKQIIESAKSIPGVLDVLDLKTAYVGPNKLLVNIEIHIKNNLDTDSIEKIIDKVKSKVRKDTPDAFHIQVEPETP
ncbi:hypothetical protein A3B52_03160 [Candidatus Curtissbacteria bacterium RIFCSPLOWO2_01_FULL_41_28]|uniref:Uncharacterized protein n=1 Tax=Candidatus Curtissbacteria bacterium RIFOXYA1_FULL_41_14 TaxID=1797737 RepID=A0A1F5HBH9_9BACT|nr:MAG: hypothetical protein A2683_00245 [Candidatus Curtissbacteria bacterium RIFCSPHIGHO2_01_FULL_34_40]OGD92315.1 MAG: hypothetical protein A3E14_02285 [Candidatus Curtissbacteria bacterium RIFCSPHIGHO2_12_FULL_41_13]OGD95014.1 MAG: hypothetical protein A3B52_03160 [Candidatus Curtissbacteria bacterium RIFCSPLOWO2_01_FULL_41_28]OGE01458.1 MAG: hypothetical protein A2196_03085 [Candidatus Curtissbacteria bacterium RIFOXYA1_FULL_41_14]OGE05596.1 MAG: hypothetical protein A2362_00955 [Candidatu